MNQQAIGFPASRHFTIHHFQTGELKIILTQVWLVFIRKEEPNAESIILTPVISDYPISLEGLW